MTVIDTVPFRHLSTSTQPPAARAAFRAALAQPTAATHARQWVNALLRRQAVTSAAPTTTAEFCGGLVTGAEKDSDDHALSLGPQGRAGTGNTPVARDRETLEAPRTNPREEPHRLVDGRYKLQRPLGHGAMGFVWQAHDHRLGRPVALKALAFRGTVDLQPQAQAVQWAHHEAQALARICHEHVVAVHDVIEAEGQVWIVMEQVSSHSLADLLRVRGRLPALQVVQIGRELLRGIQAVHAAGVLHRDIKPHNVCFRPDDRAVLIDFGLAALTDAGPGVEGPQTVGTPQYLAPELAAPWSQPQEATPAADLWALGVTLYEAVEGRLPFRGPTPYEVLEQVRTAQPPPMRHAGPLRALIDGLLAKDPAERLTAHSAAKALEACRNRSFVQAIGHNPAQAVGPP
ncbi:hypothetical protein GCM10010145_69700 [Streptomyces ruber]|uniref:non-specific serine/threonine protein kinase n=2 Tax=Streptomyces TaxID=1883 RepID=A0A918BVB8_9ACTN|nr:serine/threonine-protein kinase [Streptomyces ruber]GGQ90524.1 hypothetical protein GCM10010145_69700 [Streptomyces ruber]